MKKEQLESKGELCVKPLLFKAGMEIKQNDAVPRKPVSLSSSLFVCVN